MWSNEGITTAVIDNLAAHPEINASWNMGGAAMPVVAGLRAAGRFFPIDDPQRVHAICEDTDAGAVELVMKGSIDGFTTSTPWQQVDPGVKAAFTEVILGQNLPTDFYPLPQVIITLENLYTEKLFGGVYCHPLLPDDWNLYPVLDATEGLRDGRRNYAPVSIPTPTVAMRKKLMGY
ncbi:hypothetical protein ES703_117929 [subsurface metagenome]